MSDKTKIEWTDATVNVINGCTVVSPGCKHCYAMKQAHRTPVRQGLTERTAGGMVWTGEVRFHEPALLQVLRWQRPRRIFWNAHGDTFHEKVPDKWIDRCFAVMAATPQHTHQVLTKRPERMRAYLSNDLLPIMIAGHMSAMTGKEVSPQSVEDRLPFSNVWLGTSVEDQKRAEERIPVLMETPAAVRWLSCEPLLGPIDLTAIYTGDPAIYWPLSGGMTDDYLGPDEDGRAMFGDTKPCGRIHWVVVGGESGPGSRPMHPAWARGIRNQCATAGVPFHFKQWGDWYASPYPMDGVVHVRYRDGLQMDAPEKDSYSMRRIGKKNAGRLLDDVQHDGYPEAR